MAKKKKTVELPTTGPCAVCQGAMKHIRSIPAAAGLAPALHCFKCEVCGCPRTEEGDPIQVARSFSLIQPFAMPAQSRGL